MEIKPVDQTVKTLLESNFYRVPRFQRPYSWDRENVSDFWTDAITADDPDYFIGSFVVYREKSASDTVLVVDGQQRITTITLLLAALRDAFKSEDLESLARGIQQLIERPDLSHDPQFVLQSESPYPYLQEYIQKFGAPELQAELGSEEEALREAYSFLKGQIDSVLAIVNKDPSIAATKRAATRKLRLVEVRNKVLRLQLILIQLNSEDDAYLIFETLNTRGKDLKVSDLVKNHLARNLRPKNKGVDPAKDKWNDILMRLEDSEVDIDVNRFLHHSWLSRYPYLPEKKLFKDIKKRIDKASAKQYLDQLVADSKLYRAIADPSSRAWRKEERSIADSLRALNLFRVVQPTPMLLSILRAYEDDRLSLKQTRDLLRSMENFHFQFSAITAQRTGGGTGLMFALGARDLDTVTTKDQASQVIKTFVKKLRDRLPTPAEFSVAFVELHYSNENPKQRPLVRYVLTRLDEHLRKQAAVDYDKMSIEHIASQNPVAGHAPLPPNVGNIGNLMLIPEKLNEKLDNKSFPLKKPLYIGAHLPLDKGISDATEWGKENIKERALAIAKLMRETIVRL